MAALSFEPTSKRVAIYIFVLRLPLRLSGSNFTSAPLERSKAARSTRTLTRPVRDRERESNLKVCVGALQFQHAPVFSGLSDYAHRFIEMLPPADEVIN